MSQHQVFIDDRRVVFVSESDSERIHREKAGRVISEADVTTESLSQVVAGIPADHTVFYVCASVDSAWKRWVAHFTLSVAAGGVVRNRDNQWLLIFRRGKWDLPKGKLDYDESPEHAAVREVHEECGISGVRLLEPVTVTFHTYSEKKKNILKKTHWYAMQYDGEEQPAPQVEEDIEKVVWMTRDEIHQEAFSNTYRSIQDVLNAYFEKHLF